jgi:hypothetical protein
VSLTSDFDFCAEIDLLAIKAIFHLALKNETMFPHNVGPFDRSYNGQAMTISVLLVDDMTNPADLALTHETTITFTLPVQITAQIPDAPDPALSQVTLAAAIQVPGNLAPLNGGTALGVDFTGVTTGDVQVPSVTGLPVLDAASFEAAIHQKYLTLPAHSFSNGGNTLIIYDGSADTTLNPGNGPGNPAITASIQASGGTQYLKVILPIHVNVPAAFFVSYGTVTFWREIIEAATSVSVVMGTEPADPALAMQIAFTNPSPAGSLVAAQLKPLVNTQLNAFGTITEPWFTLAAAQQVIAAETALYIAGRQYPMYTPESGDPAHPLSDPIGFLLPAAGVLAILMNRRPGNTAADDTAPDDFTGGGQLALAVGRPKLDETIHDAIETSFPGIDTGNSEITTDQGSATMHTLTVTPSDPGAHGQAQGHLWAEGTATVHIPCWPDPDVSFSGPIFLTIQVTETDTTCSALIVPVMGKFDTGESCCDVFVDLIIPIVGWIMLAVVESTINAVGGALAASYASNEATEIQAIPPVVAGVAQLESCLESINVSSQGLVFPGKLRIRRDGLSFEDLQASDALPQP